MTTYRDVANGFEQSYPSYRVKVTDSSGVVHDGDRQHAIIEGLVPSVTVGQLSNYTTPTVEASKVVKSSAGKLFVISGFNSSTTTDTYIHVFNTTSVPANGTTPLFYCEAFFGRTFGYIAPNLYGRYFDTGITIVQSTTQATLTIATGGNITMHLDVNYL